MLTVPGEMLVWHAFPNFPKNFWPGGDQLSAARLSLSGWQKFFDAALNYHWRLDELNMADRQDPFIPGSKSSPQPDNSAGRACPRHPGAESQSRLGSGVVWEDAMARRRAPPAAARFHPKSAGRYGAPGFHDKTHTNSPNVSANHLDTPARRNWRDGKGR